MNIFPLLSTPLGPFTRSAGSVTDGIWNLPPNPEKPSRSRPNILRVALAMSLYFAVLAFGAVLRRHLMVRVIFAPRYSVAGFGLLVVGRFGWCGSWVGRVLTLGRGGG
ncbi:hypothetical protein BDR06DRAFT_963752 [Suillus hirtellus]|nr:hypothetical protein BDR06DRAFT_963752 [Suillus hirtellus]